MGGTSWSDDHYTSRAVLRAKAGKPTFAYHAAVTAKAAMTGDRSVIKVHEKLDPKGVIRESRDSDAHPESLAIAVMFDVTGSMASVPNTLQQKLPQLMGLLLRKGYVEHPQILFGAIGDATCDRVPLQIGQFESGAEMDDDVTNLVLEGGGGGQNTESYELAIYFFANRTSCDCFEKRGKKGYLFILGDERPYPQAARSQLEEVLGVTEQSNIPTAELMKQAQEKWEVFFVALGGTSHFGEKWLGQTWKELVGLERFLELKDPSAVCELVGATIGACEGSAIDRIADDLAAVGTSKAIVKAVTDIVSTTVGGGSGAIVKATGGIPAASGGSNAARI